jgi:hypothetical protein
VISISLPVTGFPLSLNLRSDPLQALADSLNLRSVSLKLRTRALNFDDRALNVNDRAFPIGAAPLKPPSTSSQMHR